MCLDDDELVDRCLLLRRWGRRSETQIYGSRKGVDRRFFSSIDGDIEYDNLFIFDEVGWNFEPSELSAAFGLVQLDKLADNLAKRKHNFERLTRLFAQRPDVFVLPRTTPDVDTAWHMFPVLIRPESGVQRSDVPTAHGTQRHRHPHGVDRQRPAPARVQGHRAPRTGARARRTRIASWNRA